MKRKIKVTNRVILPAYVDGFGEDRSGTVTEVKPCFGRTLVTVKYDKPDPDGRMGIVVYEHQVKAHCAVLILSGFRASRTIRTKTPTPCMAMC